MNTVGLALRRMTKGAVLSAERRSFPEWVRFFVIAGLALLLLTLAHVGLRFVLNFFERDVTFGYISPSLLATLILSSVSPFVFFSSLSHMVGTLTQGADNEVVYPSPRSPSGLYFLRLTETCVSSCWMTFLFSLALFSAVAAHAGAPVLIMLPVSAILVVFFSSLCALGVVFALVLLRTLPPAVVNRYLGWSTIALIAVLALYFFRSSSDVNPVVRVLRAGSSAAIPSSWPALVMGDLILGLRPATEPLLAFTFFFVFCVGAGALTSELLFRVTASRALERPVTGGTHRVLLKFAQLFPAKASAVLLRELGFISRTPSSVVHMVFITILVAGYLAFVHHVHLSALVGSFQDLRIRTLILSSQLAAGGYLATIFLSRLILPLTSLEGRAVWISLCSPASPLSILRIRRLFWFVPVALLATGVGLSALDAPGYSPANTLAVIVVTGSVLGWVLLNYALGFGAMFANFRWNHPGELIASIGSMVFMVSAVLTSSAVCWGAARVIICPATPRIISASMVALIAVAIGHMVFARGAKEVVFPDL